MLPIINNILLVCVFFFELLFQNLHKDFKSLTTTKNITNITIILVLQHDLFHYLKQITWKYFNKKLMYHNSLYNIYLLMWLCLVFNKYNYLSGVFLFYLCLMCFFLLVLARNENAIIFCLIFWCLWLVLAGKIIIIINNLPEVLIPKVL